ncbi:hypothetical protein N7456_002661 [Penicillium angulare]|uniref:Major facilitator superfamily (MFS) profile domain-containing protein n=1 Tax=Penicillium angulare TaxID=116970 RepID=A0A9W9G9T4_9EURO|nr:hypothetical protein N7456_002661 [Penicillium angulare]
MSMENENQGGENEAAPLLGPRSSRSSPASQQKPRIATFLLTMCIFLLSTSSTMIQVPLIQLMENNLCDRYLGEIGQLNPLIDRKICKGDGIQSKLAYLTASIGAIESVTGLIVAFPYGVLADKLGRKPIVYLSATGTALYLAYALAVLNFSNILAIEYMLLGPLFTAIGGGSTVINASLYSLASDLVPDTNIAVSYFMMAFGGLSGSSAGPTISSKLMEKFSPWLPTLIGSLILPTSMSLLIFLPEIIVPRDDSSERGASEWGELSSSRFKSRFSQSLSSLKALVRKRHFFSILLILVTYLRVMPEDLAYGQLLVQYVSKRYGWSFADVGYLLTARGITQTFTLLILFPVISHLLSKYMRPAVKNLILARALACLVIVGSLLTGAPHIGLAIFGLMLQASGAGLSPICRAIAISYMASQDKSKVNAMIGMLETLGSLFAGPTLAWLFALGMKLGDVWFGLPYFGLAGWCLLCLLGLLFIVPAQDQEIGDPDENQSSTASCSD